MQQLLTGKTRLPGFSETWETKQIADFTDCTAGGTPSTLVKEYWGGTIRWMNSGELTSKRILDVEGRITARGLRESGTRIIPPQCVLIGLAGQGKTRGTVAINLVELCTNQSIAAIVPNDCFVPEYLFYNLDARYHELRRMSTGDGGRGGLNLKIIRSIAVPFPEIGEQRAIATVLSDTDKLIGSLETLISKKRAIKKATMQQLLTGKTRLPGFSDTWETKQIGEIVSIRNQKIVPSDVCRDTPCVELDCIGQDDGRLLRYSKAQHSKSTKYRFFSGDVLFGRLRSYLRKYWHADRDGVCTTEIWPLMVNPHEVDSGFLYLVVQSDRFIKAATISYGTHMPRADWNVIDPLTIYLPPLLEQKAIAGVLSDMDSAIAALELRREKTRHVKRGMMQVLLTGRVRLINSQMSLELAPKTVAANEVLQVRE